MELQLKKIATQIATEITENKDADIDWLIKIISRRFKAVILNYIDACGTKEEAEYLRMLDIQSKNRIGSSQYISTGYKLSQLKAKKSAANRAANNLRREDNYERLKHWIINKYGQDEFDLFSSEMMSNNIIPGKNIFLDELTDDDWDLLNDPENKKAVYLK